jgi:hypothetical protein
MPNYHTGTGRVVLAGTGAAVLTVTANLVARYRADQGVTKDGANAVSAWADISGNGRTLSQGTGANQPTWTAAAVGGKPAITFDGINDFLGPASFTLNQPVSCYALAKVVFNAMTGQRVIDGSTALTTLYLPSGAKLGIYAGSAVNEAVSSLVDGTWYVWSYILNGASSQVRRNLFTATTGNPGAANPGGITLGAQSTGALPANVCFAEVLTYSAAHNASTQESVIRYLGRYGKVAV